MNLLHAYTLCRDLNCLMGYRLTKISPVGNSPVMELEFEDTPRVTQIYRVGKLAVIKAEDYRLVLSVDDGIVIGISSYPHTLAPRADTIARVVFDGLTLFYSSPIKTPLGISAYKCGAVPIEYKNLGHDLFDVRVTPKYLKNKLLQYNKESHCIVDFLRNTGVCAYIDLDYLSEALFVANLSPAISIARLLRLPYLEDVLDIIIRSLRFAYARGLDCFYDGSVDVPLESLFQVHGRVGEPCAVCGAHIQSIKEVCWCPRCQEEGTLCKDK